jgi:tetratricopeptide (TPR) repeat protein
MTPTRSFSSPILPSFAAYFVLFCCVLCVGCINEPTSLSDQWNDRGNTLAGQGRYEEALTAYNTSLTYDADDASTYTYRGTVLHRLGRISEAMNDFDYALMLNPSEKQAWIAKASVYIDTGEYFFAEQAARRAIDAADANSDKGVADAYLIHGFALNRLGRHEPALRAFDLAITFDPERKDLWEHKAYTLVNMGRLTEALQCYDYLIQIYPDEPQLWDMKGSVHMALGQTAEANRAYATAKSIMLNSR